MTNNYFGTDGIRGVANNGVLTADLAMKVGMAAGQLFQRGEHRHRVLIGKDTRLSGYMIENALTAGFVSVGMDVLLVGPMPTPAVAMLTRSMRADLGVMISASHNKFEDNGIKLFAPSGYKLSDELEQQISYLVDNPSEIEKASSKLLGRAKRVEGVHARYVEYAKRTLLKPLDLEGVRVVIDSANGAAYKVAPEALWELGAEVVSIGDDPNGFNINDDCGSTHPEALCRKVREVRADIGIALDGDADRVIISDEHGQVIDGDQVMAAIAKHWFENKRLNSSKIVSTIMSNLGLENYLKSIGIDLIRTPVGDRNVFEAMRANNINLGGEPSGHIILSDFATTGDGLVTALQLLSIMQSTKKPISEICNNYSPVEQTIKNVRVKDKSCIETDELKNLIEKAHAEVKSFDGRLIIRPSGTEPVIRIMIEANDKKKSKNIISTLEKAITSA